VAQSESKEVLVIAPDRPTASHVVEVLRAFGLEPSAVFAGERAWAGRALEAVDRSRRPVLLLTPALKLGRAQLDLVDRVSRSDGVALVWAAAPPTAAGAREDRVTEHLLVQRGALTDSRLRVLAEAARVLCFRRADRLTGVHLSRQSSALGARLKAALAQAGVRPVRRRGKGAGSISLDKSGMLTLGIGTGPRLVLSDVDTAARALALVTNRRPAASQISGSSAEPDLEVVDLIARPPARLLSETTSKRLLAAFGIEAGPEHLCGSATEAARSWAEIGGPVVLKLVRPELESKADHQAVISGVDGAAAVRRAYHGLRSVAQSLGPPEPLGVLVAAQISRGARVWVKLEDHPKFGRLVVGGTGDRPSAQPSIALTAPIAAAAARAALERAGVVAAPEAVKGLAEGLAAFGRMVRDLADRVTRAEVHPLVVPEGGDRAVALDALIGIAG
jgi:hypothetical protein